MRNDRAILSMTLTRYPVRRPVMQQWRSIVAALALKAFMLTMIGAVVWRLL